MGTAHQGSDSVADNNFMPISKLHGTREDMIILSGLIEKYFKDRQNEEYIPADVRCAVSFKLWPVKQFRISMKTKNDCVGVSTPFIPDIKTFSDTVETLIQSLIEDLELRILKRLGVEPDIIQERSIENN